MRSQAFLDAARSSTLIFNGAMGTQLMAAGAPLERKIEWNVSHPEIVAAVHRSYVEAGCDVILTNTFVANRAQQERCGYGHRVAELSRAATRIAREAAADDAYVAADLGPTGHILEPYGDTTHVEVVEIFKEQLGAQIEEGPDLILVETFVALEEAEAALDAIAQLDAGLPVVATMSFDAGDHTSFGVDGATAARRLGELGADLVGGNCAYGDGLIVAMAAAREATDRPIMCKPNAGLPRLIAGETVFAATAAEFGEFGRRLKAVGVQHFGGCCGTTPDHIRALRRAVLGA
jgi:5-methyltetrahydrofolate--homocysteine methyltransferase